jgi:4-amino-4-deoxy-L-arabinose transferase-like glycosyltransferase
VLALVMRGLVVAAILPEPERAITGSDAEQYLALANTLARHGLFSRDAEPPYTPETVRTPGYPVFLVPFVGAFGPRPLIPVVAAQGLIGALTVAGTACLGRRLFDEQTGILAGLLLAISPMSIIMGGAIYSETWYTAWLVGGLWLLAAGLMASRPTLSGLGGLVLGLSALIRPIGLPMLVVWGALPLARIPIRQAYRHILAIVAGFMLAVSPWMGRNAVQFGHFALSSISADNLYYYNVASTEAHRLGTSLDESREQLARRLAADPLSDDWLSAAQGRLARQVILEHPLAFIFYNGVDALNGLRPGFSRLLLLLGPEGTVDDPIAAFRQGSLPEALAAAASQSLPILLAEVYMVAHVAILAAASAAGLLILIRRRLWLEAGLLGVTAAVLLYLPGSASNARFRAPVEPLLAILAAICMVAVARWAARRRAADRHPPTR